VNSIFMIGLLVLGGVTIISMIRGLVFQHKLWDHLRSNHTEKWQDLTFIGKWGLGLANGQKAIAFLFSREDLNDAEVLRLKVLTRNSFVLQLAGFVALFVWASFMTDILIHF